MVKKYDSTLSRFHTKPERNGRTDRQTDGRTDLLYQYRASVCWRAIKVKSCRFSRWRISAILDFRGPVMGFLKSPCTTSYKSSRETIAVNCSNKLLITLFQEKIILTFVVAFHNKHVLVFKGNSHEQYPVIWKIMRWSQKAMNEWGTKMCSQKHLINKMIQRTLHLFICICRWSEILLLAFGIDVGSLSFFVIAAVMGLWARFGRILCCPEICKH